MFKETRRLPTRRSNAHRLSKSSERRRKTSRSPMKKEDRQYQRFVHGLQRDIHLYLDQCLRENRFDTRPTGQTTKSSIVHPSRPTSKLSTCRSSETGTYISSVRRPDDPFELMKKTERKRLTADIDTILKGPSLKTFYKQFFEKPTTRTQRQSFNSIPWEESQIIWDIDEKLM